VEQRTNSNDVVFAAALDTNESIEVIKELVINSGYGQWPGVSMKSVVQRSRQKPKVAS
jgi:hypothetical protein